MSPAAIAKTAAGLLVTGIVLALLGLFPPLWILPLAVGGTFTATCFVAGQTCYPRYPSLWVACAIMPLVTTLMAFWVIEEARKIAVSLVVRRYDSQLRTDIVTMLRDRPEDYPAEQAEILREERLLRLDEIMADGHGTEQTYEAAVKARDYLTNQLPRERGFRYRVNQTRLTRQVTEKIQAATGSPKPGPITVPPGGLITVLEDRAGLGARFLRHALFDLWSDREISRRAACDIDEVAWILECRWGEPVLEGPGRRYPCDWILIRVDAGSGPTIVARESIPAFAKDDTTDDGGAETLFMGGEEARRAAIRQKLKDLSIKPAS